MLKKTIKNTLRNMVGNSRRKDKGISDDSFKTSKPQKISEFLQSTSSPRAIDDEPDSLVKSLEVHGTSELEVHGTSELKVLKSDKPSDLGSRSASLASVYLSSESDSEEEMNVDELLTVAVAESVTAGALSNTLCSEPGSSKFFLGGVVAYNMASQKAILNVDDVYAEENTFANPFTTLEMARNVAVMFGSRIGLSTTGFSLPTHRDASDGKCEIDVRTPYAYVCLYDSVEDIHKVVKVVNDNYLRDGNQKMQRAQMQVKVSLACKTMFIDYCAAKN